jgi:transposase-like protein
MPKKKRTWSRDLKISAVKRMLAGENTTALAKELKVRRTILYRWRDSYRKDGARAFPGRPGPRPRSMQSIDDVRLEAAGSLAAAEKRIAALERKIGQQQVELDFFQRALRQVGASQPISGLGAKASTPSSKR